MSMFYSGIQLDPLILILLFFFQAEDGIRDYKVTGVQTCALPISEVIVKALRHYAIPRDAMEFYFVHVEAEEEHGDNAEAEIGRASCRERGVDLGGRRIIKKKKKKCRIGGNSGKM